MWSQSPKTLDALTYRISPTGKEQTGDYGDGDDDEE